jgi:hypothetical protein
MDTPPSRDALLWNALKQKIELEARYAKVSPEDLQVSWCLRHGNADFTLTLRGKTTFFPITYSELLRDNGHPSPISPLAKGIIRALLSRETTPTGARLA